MQATPDLANGFDIIRRYDPALYERMQRSNWRVSTSYEVLSEDEGLFGYLNAHQAYGDDRDQPLVELRYPRLPA